MFTTYNKKKVMEEETCEFCKKVVVIDPVQEDEEAEYMIANCDSCDAMTCRECLTTNKEGQCKGCYEENPHQAMPSGDEDDEEEEEATKPKMTGVHDGGAADNYRYWLFSLTCEAQIAEEDASELEECVRHQEFIYMRLNAERDGYDFDWSLYDMTSSSTEKVDFDEYARDNGFTLGPNEHCSSWDFGCATDEEIVSGYDLSEGAGGYYVIYEVKAEDEGKVWWLNPQHPRSYTFAEIVTGMFPEIVEDGAVDMNIDLAGCARDIVKHPDGHSDQNIKWAEVKVKEDEEEEENEEITCRDCDYSWGTKEQFELGKGRVAFSAPTPGIEGDDKRCSLCEKEDEEEEDDEEEHEYEYHNYGTESEPMFGEVSYQVAGGGLSNGNAYATVELKDGIYFYCEYGKHDSRVPVGNKIVWSDEYRRGEKDPYESRSFDILDEEEVEVEEEEEEEEDEEEGSEDERVCTCCEEYCSSIGGIAATYKDDEIAVCVACEDFVFFCKGCGQVKFNDLLYGENTTDGEVWEACEDCFSEEEEENPYGAAEASGESDEEEEFCICVCDVCESSHGDDWIGCESCDESYCHKCNNFTSKVGKENWRVTQRRMYPRLFEEE